MIGNAGGLMQSRKSRNQRRLEVLESRLLLTADLHVELLDIPSEVRASEALSYRLRVTNDGDEKIRGALVTSDVAGLDDMRWERRSQLAPIDLDRLDGRDGFAVAALEWDTQLFQAGVLGDINGGGADDLVFRGPDNDFFVLFGEATNGVEVIGPRQLDGHNGFRFSPSPVVRAKVAAVGDVNGDGVDDWSMGDDAAFTIFFGRANWQTDAIVDMALIQVEPGATLTLDTTGVGELEEVREAGDFNGDGIGDILVRQRNRAFVLFGRPADAMPESVALNRLDPSDGVVIEVESDVGTALGDFNGDGMDDLVFGGNAASRGGYVIFGFATNENGLIDVNALDGTNGFGVASSAANEFLGLHVSGVGDVNGDGFDDVMMTSFVRDAAALLIFGQSEVDGQTISSTDSASSATMRIRLDADVNNRPFFSAIGDVDGDGIADFMIGRSGQDSAHLIYGHSQFDALEVLTPSKLTAEQGVRVFRETSPSSSPSAFARSVGHGDFNRDGITDVMIGADEVYIVYGSSSVSGSGTLNDVIDLAPGSSFVYDVRGIPLSESEQVTVLAEALLCGSHDHVGEASLDVQVRPAVAPEGQAGYQIRVTSLEEDRVASVQVRSQLSRWLRDAVWRRQLGKPPIVSLAGADRGHGIENPIYVRPSSVTAVGDVNGDQLDDFTFVLNRDGTGLFLSLGGESGQRLFEWSHAVQPFGGVGDFNGDGFDDLIYWDGSDVAIIHGEDDLDFETDIRIQGIGGATNGTGDFNGDGFDDVVMIAHRAEITSLGIITIFGGSRETSFDVNELNGTNGFQFGVFFDILHFGGDVNGDGFDDFVAATSQSNEAFVVFGAASTESGLVPLSDLDGSNGFRIDAAANISAITTVGDVNADGFDDVIVTTDDETRPAQLIFGGARVGESGEFALADAIKSVTFSARAHLVVSELGDFNGDGIDDVLFGDSRDIGSTIRQTYRGDTAYVVFGSPELDSRSSIALPELNGLDGFTLQRHDGGSVAGLVSNVGDKDGDGLQDLVVRGIHRRLDAFSGPGWQLLVVGGEDAFLNGAGDLTDHVRVEPGATVVYDITGITTSSEELDVVVEAMACVPQIDATPVNNRVATSIVVANTLAGDLDLDGQVSFSDFIILSANYGRSDASPAQGDINEDGEVNFQDFIELQANFGRSILDR